MILFILSLSSCAEIKTIPGNPATWKITKYSGGKVVFKDTFSSNDLIFDGDKVVGYIDNGMKVILSGDYIIKQLTPPSSDKYEYNGKVYNSYRDANDASFESNMQ
jgi:uncharacterized membrane protein YccF (DUF307 family)